MKKKRRKPVNDPFRLRKPKKRKFHALKKCKI